MKKERGITASQNFEKTDYENDENPKNEFDENSSSSAAASSTSFPAVRFSSRNASSKYDFVKVKVWLGDNADHYYVLSRFLLSRMLTVTKIPNHVATKISLELKKLLVDNSLLDVSQSDLEANLFKLMERRGYGEEYINRYKMMTRFHHQRVPLVILVCGTACVGKSTIATQLAQRLNLPNVLQTDMVYELLRTSTDAPLASTPVWARDFSSSEELITEFCRECRVVRKGLAGDLKKAMKDGKPIIIEGIHLDPSIYLMDDENKQPADATAKDDENKQPADATAKDKETHAVSMSSDDVTCEQPEQTSCASKSCMESFPHGAEGVTDQVNNVFSTINLSSDLAEYASGVKGESESNPETDNADVRKKSKVAEPIIISIVLNMAEFDHKALLEEWISSRTFSDNCVVEDKSMLITNLKTIQDYLCSFKTQGVPVVNVSATTFPQTLDWLHNYLLQRIEQGISEASDVDEGMKSKN